MTKREGLLFVMIALLALVLAGCVEPGFAGQVNGAAGGVPSPAGSTPQAGEVGAWEHHRFFDVWDIGYPDGWNVSRPGTGAVQLSGPYGGRQYRVLVTRPTGVQADDLAGWVQADLAQIGQTGAPRTEVQVSNVPALKVSNLRLPDINEHACPVVRVYARTDKLIGEQNYLVMTITESGAASCDAAGVERLADALISEVKP